MKQNTILLYLNNNTKIQNTIYKNVAYSQCLILYWSNRKGQEQILNISLRNRILNKLITKKVNFVDFKVVILNSAYYTFTI